MSINLTQVSQPAPRPMMPVAANPVTGNLFDLLTTDGVPLSETDIQEITRLERCIQADMNLDDEEDDD
ncbi:hypothetical protein [Spirosoma areae]